MGLFFKAFDKFSHSLLLHKLHNYRIESKVNSWIESLIANRTQAVIIESERSTYVPIESGVLQ